MFLGFGCVSAGVQGGSQAEFHSYRQWAASGFCTLKRLKGLGRIFVFAFIIQRAGSQKPRDIGRLSSFVIFCHGIKAI